MYISPSYESLVVSFPPPLLIFPSAHLVRSERDDLSRDSHRRRRLSPAQSIALYDLRSPIFARTEFLINTVMDGPS